ncbi:ferritin-like domain-containing protein [Streptomyces scopuliridis]|uniref:Ferritin-like domain-containing protein n=1 Tax=Streptomyces scopuliridis TaxID=452529 RepID=A0ACD5A0T8_9ACTN|nr:ferritin-like domain-containing protein [Streptomyces scopuliridis]WSB38526.1 ferritin-like domain-containing protein [Streptomyces scopuliridis]WSC02977.1 ferritin-like domain-containing protein [Streptomyces scopuliridis]WSC11149.1 ferritin-like domain-containing protein [Streptomyces scopuliridis]
MDAERIDTRLLEPTTRDDIMALQTAASLENLAVSVYRTAAALPFIKDGNATLQEFIATTTQHHEEHAKAFNTAAVQAGGQPQTGTDPKYAAVVQQALPAAKTPEDVVALALSLEDVAAQTYTKDVGLAGTARLRRLFASVAPVEAQHRATLLVVQSLLGSGDSDLIAIPTDAAALPADVGTAGFPDAFYPTSNASPISEGAVQ